MTEKEHFVAMDYMRYIMALGVVIAHYNLIMGSNFCWPVSSGTAVSLFFGLSGFLVFATYKRRNTIKAYLLSRAKRIIPTYTIIVLLSAILLSFVSTLSFTEYFGSCEFWKYIGANICFMNFLQPTLPGVFTDSVEPAVNGSLWTLKVEWALYFSIPLFDWIMRRFKLSAAKLIASIFVLSVIYKAFMEYMFSTTGNQIYHIMSYQFMGQLTFFYSGVLIYLKRDYCNQHKLSLFIASAITCLVCMIIKDNCNHWTVGILFDLLFPLAIVTFILMICSTDWHTIHLPRIPNLSYELYLIHFPIVQVVAQEVHVESNMLFVVFIAELLVMLIASQLLSKATRSLFHNVRASTNKQINK